MLLIKEVQVIKTHSFSIIFCFRFENSDTYAYIEMRYQWYIQIVIYKKVVYTYSKKQGEVRFRGKLQ